MSEGVFEPVHELVEKVSEEITDMTFDPRPGGIIDRFQKEKARKQARDEENRHEDEPINDAAYTAVKVAQEAPEVVATNLVTIPSLGIGQLLPSSPYRYRAFLMLPTPAGIVNALSLISTPAVPASTINAVNYTNQPYNVTITGGTLTAVTVNGQTVGTTAGTYIVPAGGTIAVTYSVAPTWTWAPVYSPAAATVTVSRDQGSALGGLGFTLPSGTIMTVQNRAQLWGFNPNSFNIQVATFSEMYGPKVPR